MIVHRFEGDVEDLEIEAGDGAGFVKMPIDELERRLDSEPEKFAAVLTDTVGRDLAQGIKNILSN